VKPGRSKDLVAGAALAGALGLGGFLLLRARGALGVSWTDGERSFRSETGASVRHAVWDLPEDLGELGEPGEGSRPALSPDGRWLVFAAGARGLNCELYLAEMVAGVPRGPRPLATLSTSADELAPAFGHGALYFASDRPGGAGKLDLWRAAYEDGAFGPAELLAGGLNSAADETDPAPLPGSRALVFASDRARADHDLYLAVPDETGFFGCEPLAALNSPAEEREPGFSDDPRALVFASDRAGGAGAFDLYRALHFGVAPAQGWRAPELVSALSTPRAERGPAHAAQG
jgi:Tol biopolymer transport system component